jgi:radical SAM superfamily enzyme YgiQ (UPF0313 family)
MKIGLLTFPRLFDNFYDNNPTLLAQRLEPSVLYVAPQQGEKVFLPTNQPQPDIDLYLCSIYTRGWNEFIEFAGKVGKEKIIAGGYHPTALPEETSRYADKVVVGYCGNIDDIIDGPKGVHKGLFTFTPMERNLIDMKSMRQVYPDITQADICGSMVSSVGCPYDCSFCSTPQMSGRKMRVSALDYVDQEIANLKSHGVTTVFIRDESFATNPDIKNISERFKGQFRMVYSFGTGAVMAKREDLVKHLVQQGWHSLNFGLEDIGVKYSKNTNLKQATDNCQRNGMQYVLSFIVNDDGKTQEEARANYKALFDAFCDYKPSQVCANFLMPFPGTGIWNEYKDRITTRDFDKFDSKTPLFVAGELREWHKRMLVAVQLKYYRSEAYKSVRAFENGDSLHLRLVELEKEFGLDNVPWERLLDL